MTLHIISRASWGARAPREVQTVSWEKRTGFVVHHSGAPESQTCRVIQNYQMDVRGWSDIGYNFLVDHDGNAFMGRGWSNVGAHAKGYNTATIGVCIIGNYNAKLPTNAALETVRELYSLANQLKGRKLALFGHREVGSTDCPGDRLFQWVHHGLSMSIPSSDTPTTMDHRPGTRELHLASPELVGADVGFVQRFIGPARCGPADNHFGPHTEAGVRWYQGDVRGIKVDGRVGPVTWGEMGVKWIG